MPHFIQLMDEETKLVNDPLFLEDVLFESSKQHHGQGKLSYLKSNLSMNDELKCPLCQRNRDLEDCNEYQQKNTEEKRKFLFRKDCTLVAFFQQH